MIGPEKLSRVTVFFRLACVTPTRFRSTRAKNCGGVFFRGLVPSKQVRLLRLLEAARAAAIHRRRLVERRAIITGHPARDLLLYCLRLLGHRAGQCPKVVPRLVELIDQR